MQKSRTRRTRKVVAPEPPNLAIPPQATFVAIDFETADYTRDSACSVALVRVEQGRVVDRVHTLLRPPGGRVRNTHIHGITWAQVRNAPTFGQVWPHLARRLVGAEYLAAHNAPFDRSVLAACCRRAGLSLPAQPFVCTLALARQQWGKPASLDAVSQRLGIPLQHHQALSDAEACARILIHLAAA
ncbi:MAG: 3'-5' exonuclease [Vulcanimicrobiota bacterium]